MHASPGRGLPFLPLERRPGSLAVGRARIGAAPLPELRGSDAPPAEQPLRGSQPGEEGLQCIGSEDDAYSTHWYDACWRVLFSNPPQGAPDRRARVAKRRQLSFLGTNGHVERANAWTHVIGTGIFAAFAALRSPLSLDVASTSGVLSTYTSITVACTFAVSTSFHTLGTVRWLSPVMRLFDHGAIDIALAMASTTDMAVVTLDFNDVPWQTTADSIGVAAAILCFFMYRRFVLPPDDTEVGWGDCRLGLFRLQHADFEYSALRSSSYIVLSFGFVMLVPAAWDNLTPLASTTIIACNACALLLLITGLLLDNVLAWPDVLYQDPLRRAGQKPAPMCHNRQCGCIMTSHAFWHVFTLLSAVTQTVGREVAIHEARVKL
jgi:predicted membrane channel-forming protein YqfA (hemolysin III family)